MINLAEQFKDCYLVQYAVAPDKTIDAIKAMPFALRESKYGGTFLGVNGGGPYGIRFVKGATHLGLFDLSDTQNPSLLYSVRYEDLALRTPVIVKCAGAYLILSRGDKNFKFYISAYKTKAEQKKALSKEPTRKLDPQTRKVNSSLKTMKHKKA